MTPVISAVHLHKRYGDTIAVKDVSLEVHKGEIFGILGPNGAGKTTTVECMQSLREPTSGTIRILGADPITHVHRLRLEQQHADGRQLCGGQRQCQLPDR